MTKLLVQNNCVSIPTKFHCSCGAVAIQYSEDCTVYCHGDNLDALIPEHKDFAEDSVTLSNPYVHCNHCVNKWGIDLCGCGCGAVTVQGERCYYER